MTSIFTTTGVFFINLGIKLLIYTTRSRINKKGQTDENIQNLSILVENLYQFKDYLQKIR